MVRNWAFRRLFGASRPPKDPRTSRALGGRLRDEWRPPPSAARHESGVDAVTDGRPKRVHPAFALRLEKLQCLAGTRAVEEAGAVERDESCDDSRMTRSPRLLRLLI